MYFYSKSNREGWKKIFPKLSIFFTILSISLVVIHLNIIDFHIFISILEISHLILSIIIATTLLSTYEVNKDEFSLLAIGYVFVSVFLFIHIFTITYNYQLKIINYGLFVIALFIEGITFFVKGITLGKKINIYIWCIIYSIFSIFIIKIISIIEENHYFYQISLYNINMIFAISGLIFYYKRKYLKGRTFKYIFISLLLKTFYIFTFSLILFKKTNNFTELIGYLSLVLSFYFLYKGIVIENLQKNNIKWEASKDILKAILESTADGILVVDTSRRVLHYNEIFVKMWNIPKEILETKDDKKFLNFVLDQLVYPEDFLKKVESLNKSPNEDRGVVLFKDGRIYERFYKPLYIGNHISGNVWSFKDITERIKIEKKLIEREALYRRLIELLPDGILLIKDEKIIMTNKQGLKLFKYNSNDEVKNKPYGEVIKPYSSSIKSVEEKIHKLMMKETTIDFSEEKLVLKDGTIIYAQIAATSFKQEDGHYVVIVIKDVSLKKNLEKLQKQTQLFSNISHEFKTPLNIILGSVQLLSNIHQGIEECIYRKKFDKSLFIMKQNCYRLLRLMNNIIDLNRVDNGFLKMNFVRHDIVSIIENITESIIDYGKTKDISIIFDTNVEEKILVVDIDKIERIFLNLLSNAIKFTDEGGEISVKVKADENKVEISVKDTGIGIPQEKLKEIFVPFKQVNSFLHRKNEGSGIGLYLTKTMVEAHGGRIRVKSKPKEGSEFIVELPCKLDEELLYQWDEVVDTVREISIEKINIELCDVYTGNFKKSVEK